MINLTGLADEAADDIHGQIFAIKTLGWNHIELRSIYGKNITNISDEEFDHIAEKLISNNIEVNAFGSTICSWQKSILDPVDSDLEEVERAIPRMKALGTRSIRIMSYSLLPGIEPKHQMLEERVTRLKKIVDRFAEEGIKTLHENSANYGGMGWPFTMELLDKVPGLRLVFDTASPATTLDLSKPKPYPVQSSWEFYKQVRSYIEHIHLKDGRLLRVNHRAQFEDAEFVWPGEGNADVIRILTDLVESEYEGYLSIEPHLSVKFHEDSQSGSNRIRFNSFIEYGQRLESLLKKITYVDEKGVVTSPKKNLVK